MNQTIHLQFSDLLVGALLVLTAAGASWAMRLQLQRQVLWASLRMVVQLLLVGYVLRLVFQHASLPPQNPLPQPACRSHFVP